jgi:hypothetical protein
VAEEEDDRSGDNRMDEMLDAIWLELETNHEDPPTLEVQTLFDMLRDSEEPLHEHTIVSILAFVTVLRPSSQSLHSQTNVTRSS